MKTILLIALLFCDGVLMAQSYQPTLGDSNKWVVRYTFDFKKIPGPVNPGNYACNVTYYTSGDSMTNNHTYKKLFLIDSFANYFDHQNGFQGLIREDTGLMQIYYLPKDSQNELIINDFSLSIGDSINLWFDDLPEGDLESADGSRVPRKGWFKVVSKDPDSNALGPVQTMKLIHTSYITHEIRWEYGLTQSSGPLYFINPLSSGSYSFYSVISQGGVFTSFFTNIVCAFKNDRQLLFKPNCNDFFVMPSFWSSTTEISQALPVALNIFCNRDGCSVYDNVGNQPEILSADIYDLNGRLIKTRKYNNHITFGGEVPNGIYVIQIETEKTSIIKKIFINN